ncbi:Uncharacterized conserved protein YbjT, contains NAD(P)-binding and DUF2867 domains [Catalinimonas alkaloidigena]|uniref:Uncharacterized conserved protein YbjT, contains NAD(P)-binding and DUF2867 domains n=1 Tax=Catalinimonas alkaloidigena TaxID=1075417 RepID=A0A1G9RBE5_9BACT|nr:SDR family oxidoreductase [Catalinimonas alkaloidigena]SDM20563.1 Uncharacterized conserved protein YbjT, contains NAD(P)-binding and DUF2867 domains [Catalinimonas alkaloidigena]
MILITGASGRVSSRLAELLSEQKQPLRLMTRHPHHLSTHVQGEIIQGDYQDPTSLTMAFAGIERAFVVSGHAAPGERAKLHRNAFEAAAQAGVKHVIYLSFQGASPTSKFPLGRDHAESEAYLKATGVPHTILRDSMYLDMLPELFNEEGVLRAPAGDGAAAFVSREDVSRVAAAVLLDPPLSSATYDVTGPEPVTLQEAAGRLSVLVGRELRYEDESLEQAQAWRRNLASELWEVDVWTGSYEALAAGELAHVTDTVLNWTKQPPAHLESYFNAHPHLLDPLRK